MKLEDLNEGDIRWVHTLYENYCGTVGRTFEAAMLKSPEEALIDLRKQGSGNYRIGSRYSENSRLIIRTDQLGKVRVEFDPRSESDESLNSKDSFEDSARIYLTRAERVSKK